MSYEPLLNQTLQQVQYVLVYVVFYRALSSWKSSLTIYFKIALNFAAIFYLALYVGAESWKIGLTITTYFIVAWLLYDFSYGGKLILRGKTKNFYLIAGLLVFAWWILKNTPLLFTIGISYLFFKLLYTTYFSLTTQISKCPRRLEYLEYAFFPITLPSGPINPFHLHDTPPEGSLFDHLRRFLEGVIKLKIFSPIVFTLTYSELSLSGYELSTFDYLICGIAYYIYMYMNFSGLTDIVISLSALVGKSTKENFNEPLRSQSIIDFWRRWHLSLTDLVRDIVFNPIYFMLVKKFGGRHHLSKILSPVVSMSAAFLIMALWHGFTVGFILYYVVHAFGFALNYVYQYSAKHFFSTGYTQLMGSHLYKIGCWFLTFIFVAFSYLLLSMGKDSWKILNSVSM